MACPCAFYLDKSGGLFRERYIEKEIYAVFFLQFCAKRLKFEYVIFHNVQY